MGHSSGAWPVPEPADRLRPRVPARREPRPTRPRSAMETPEREVFTTGEAARICNVTIKTVIRWFETGELKGYKIPGSRDRRIPRDNLVDFMTRHGMPLRGLEKEARRKRILIVDDEADIVDVLRRFFTDLDVYEIETATNGYTAGALTATF